MSRVEPADTRAVLAVREVHVEIAQERRDRHPEIIPHDDDRLDSRAVALSEGLDQFRSLQCRVRVQPLLELIENQQQLVAGGSDWPLRIAARSSLRDNSAGNPGTAFRMAVPSRASAALGAASTNTETTRSARRGSSPALTSDDFPHPDGP